MPKNVLVIEDEPYILWLIKYLAQRGHIVTWAKSVSDAHSAIDEAGHQGFAVAIVDVLMPASDETEADTAGIKLAQRIRRTTWGADTIIVMYSVLKPEDFRKRAKTVGLNPKTVKFWSKQSDEGELKKYLEQEAGI